MIYLDKHDRFILCITPKCASEAWRDWFYNSQSSQRLDFLNAGINSKTNRLAKAQLLPEPEATDIPVIQVVREPLSRLVAAYYDKIGNPSSTRYKKNFKSFGQWVEYLYKDRGNKHRWDTHWRPQVLTPEGYKPTKYITLSNMQEGIAHMCALLDKPHAFPPNKKENKRRYEGKAIDQYSEETKAMAEEIYEEDLKMYSEATGSPDYVSVPKKANKIDLKTKDTKKEAPKKKEEVKTISGVPINMSAEGNNYRQHVALAPSVEAIEMYKDVPDIYSRNLFNTLSEQRIAELLEAWKGVLAPQGTVFCKIPSDPKNKTDQIARFAAHFTKAGFKVTSKRQVDDEIRLKACKPADVSTATQKGFAWTSAYGGCWPEKCLSRAKHPAVAKSKIKGLDDFRRLSSSKEIDILILGNFTVERHAIKTEATRLGIDTIHGEDGFIPHYSTLHVDPLGFCWESSLTRMLFRESNVTDDDRKILDKSATLYKQNVKENIHKANPYVLFPLQLIGDKVNRFGLNIGPNWLEILKHARACIPSEVDMIVKPHPRGAAKDVETYKKWVATQNNVKWDDRKELYTLLHHSAGVVGMNSTVLTEARIMMNKPVWAYAPSWYSNHHDLVHRIDHQQPSRELPFSESLASGIPKSEYLEEYRLWYHKQLLARQYTQQVGSNPDQYKKWLFKRSYFSYLEHGEDIFCLEGRPF